MKSKVQERQKAVDLRKKGYTYKEIMNEIRVAKSSLSLWLKDLPLTKREKKYLKNRIDSNISRGRIKSATSNRNNRLARESEVVKEAKKQFQDLNSNPFFLVGVALYWAEGAKRSNSFQFMNSDPEMIRTFVSWLESILEIDRKSVNYRLFIHKPYAHENCEKFWSGFLKVPLKNFKKTIYKPTSKLVKKRPNYKGCLRVEVTKSSKLLLKMKVWQNMLAQKYLKLRP